MLLTNSNLVEALGQKRGNFLYQKLLKSGFIKSTRIRGKQHYHVRAWDSEEAKKVFPEFADEIAQLDEH